MDRREYYKKYNKEHKLDKAGYYLSKRRDILLQQKQYHQKNKAKINRYYRNKTKASVPFNLAKNLRSRLNKAIVGKSKSLHTLQLLGCSITQLKQNLERKFKSGMSWKNYGKWHIDHIRPCASFNLSKPEEQKKCFHYTNLQPLWAKENLMKKDKYLTQGE